MDTLLLAIFALIGFIFRLQALSFKGNLKFYDYDKEIAKKYEIYFLLIESKKYSLFHYLGILLSAAVVVCSLVDNILLTAITIICCFVYLLTYGLKFEKYIIEAGENERKCVFLLKYIINLNGKNDYKINAHPEDANALHFLYLCCNHDKMTLLFDLVPMLLLTLAVPLLTLKLHH